MGDAWIGLAGVIAGALLTYGFTILTESRRWAREDKHRFTADRRRV